MLPCGNNSEQPICPLSNDVRQRRPAGRLLTSYAPCVSATPGCVQAQSEAYLEELQHLPPQDHVAAVKPLWETLAQAQRDALLTVGLDDLRAHARARAAAAKKAADADTAEALQIAGGVVICLDPPLDEVLEEALARSKERGTWKVWQWGDGDRQFFDSESFRRHLEEEVLTEEQRRALPREEEGVKAVEKPAEAALRQRMVALLQRVQAQRTQQEEAADAARRPSGRRYDPANATRDANIDLITLTLSALQSEHEALYHHVLHPVTACVCDALPEGSRQTTRSELHYEDLEKLAPGEGGAGSTIQSLDLGPCCSALRHLSARKSSLATRLPALCSSTAPSPLCNRPRAAG